MTPPRARIVHAMPCPAEDCGARITTVAAVVGGDDRAQCSAGHRILVHWPTSVILPDTEPELRLADPKSVPDEAHETSEQLDATKLVDPAELHNAGYVQEVNREFFHPLGMALMLHVDERGRYEIGGVIDMRADPEGIFFDGPGVPDRDKADAVEAERAAKRGPRLKALGYVVQPLPAPESASDDG